MPFIAIALILAAALGGGTAVAAQSALPGDPLWNFKVDVNEKVVGMLSASDKAQADWDIAAIQERLDEAERLAANGPIDAQAQAELSANLDAHVKDAADKIAILQAKGDTQDAMQAAANFQSVMASGASTLGQSSFASQIDAQLDQASVLSANAAAAVQAGSGL